MLNDELKLPDNLLFLLKNTGPVTRRKALKAASAYLRKVNAKRIKANVQPDGSPMRRRQKSTGGRKAQRMFLYENAKGKRHYQQLMTVKDEGDYLIGYELVSGSVQRFRKDRIVKEYKRQPKNALSMFQQMTKHMKRVSRGELEELGFYGRTGKAAAAHHFGKTVREKWYDVPLPMRMLLGISDEDAEAVGAIFLEHIMAGQS